MNNMNNEKELQQQTEEMKKFLEEYENFELQPNDDIDEDDDFADFRTLSEEEQKWALIQMQLDAEQKYLNNNFLSE